MGDFQIVFILTGPFPQAFPGGRVKRRKSMSQQDTPDFKFHLSLLPDTDEMTY